MTDGIDALEVHQVAALLGLNAADVFELVTSEGLPASQRHGRWQFDSQEVTAWMDERAVEAVDRRHTRPCPICAAPAVVRHGCVGYRHRQACRALITRAIELEGNTR